MTSGDSVSLIKENYSLATLVNRYTQLKRKGGKLTACCPFHSEKTPSFYVDDQKGLYHCFGCGKGGDLIAFCQEIEGFGFTEALDFLADLAGVDLPKYRRDGPGREVVESLRAIYQEATQYYHHQLTQNAAAKSYFEKRDIRTNTLGLFKLGYATPQWDGLYLHLKDQFDAKLLDQSGLFKTTKNGKVFDLFRDRVMFPISDAYGHVVAFGGRMISGEDGPKYINSPESPLYVKGKHLYNLQFAKAFFKKIPEVVVVEGYTDAIQVYQSGVGNVIASLGTAFTPEQGKLLKRHVPKVILNFDGDAAGFKAARQSIETLLRLDVDVSVVSLPDKQDPDDFVRQQGIKAYREQLKGARGFFDFLMTYLAEEKDWQNNPRHRSVIAQEMSQTLSCIGDPVVQSHYLKQLSEKLEIAGHVLDQILTQKSTKPERQPPPRVQPPSVNPTKPFNNLEEEFLFHVMHRKDFATALQEEHREMLPKILENLFYDRPWVLDFIYGDDHPELEERLNSVPDELKPHFRALYFNDAYEHEDSQRLEILFPDLLKQMLEKLVKINTQRMRLLPPEKEDQKREIMRRNQVLNRQVIKL